MEFLKRNTNIECSKYDKVVTSENVCLIWLSWLLLLFFRITFSKFMKNNVVIVILFFYFTFSNLIHFETLFYKWIVWISVHTKQEQKKTNRIQILRKLASHYLSLLKSGEKQEWIRTNFCSVSSSFSTRHFTKSTLEKLCMIKTLAYQVAVGYLCEGWFESCLIIDVNWLISTVTQHKLYNITRF